MSSSGADLSCRNYELFSFATLSVADFQNNQRCFKGSLQVLLGDACFLEAMHCPGQPQFAVWVLLGWASCISSQLPSAHFTIIWSVSCRQHEPNIKHHR